MDANPIFRRSVPGIVGSPVTSAMTRADAVAHLPLWRELMDGRRARYEIAATLRRPDGTTVSGHVVVTAVVAGSGEVTGAVAIAAPDSPDPPSVAPRREQPTAAEIAVLTGLASGLTLQQVAARLGLTRRGVDYRLARLRQKLRSDDPGGIPATTAGVVARGYAMGLLAPGIWPPRPGPGA